MKKILFLGIGSALVFTMSGVGTAQADNGPHISTAAAAGSGLVNVNVASGANRCASCHRAHTAKAEYLLKEAQPALCYTCHGGGWGSNTDVQNGTSGAVTGGTVAGALRGGGFDTAAISSGAASKSMGALDPVSGRIATSAQTIPVLGGVGTVAPVATTSRHQIDGITAGTAWGNGALDSGIGKSLTLECGSCHDPHGNGNYRILRPVPVDSGAATPGIKIPDATTKVYTTANYWLSGDVNAPVGGVAYTNGTSPVVPQGNGNLLATDGYIQNVAAWCTTCHTRYLAGSKSYKNANRGYPTVDGATGGTVDSTFMYRHRSDANYKAGAANCITCHVSHGSNASMVGSTVEFPGASTASADSRLLRVDGRGTCVMCHNV